jgi:hypothetical protein
MYDNPNRPPIHSRIEIPVHYNLWMQGARFGLVTQFRHGRVGQSDYVLVKMEHPQIKRSIKLWEPDWQFCKVIS